MELPIPRIAVVGSGYWGRNLVRNFHELGALRVVCDTREESMQEARVRYGVRTTADLDLVLNDEEIDGVVIAAPAAQHFQLAAKCLLHDKDVYVEKPLALHAEEGRQLVRLASERNRILMVGHILRYHPAILRLQQLIQDGALGKINYLYSNRLNIGKIRRYHPDD